MLQWVDSRGSGGLPWVVLPETDTLGLVLPCGGVGDKACAVSATHPVDGDVS